jgi:LDH2 family malate/lactate/ureidoglycolate dehydrogenase
MDRYIKSLKESAKAKGAQEILMPGEPEYRTETRFLKEGIPLAPNTVRELTTLGESLGLSLPGNPESEAAE